MNILDTPDGSSATENGTRQLAAGEGGTPLPTSDLRRIVDEGSAVLEAAEERRNLRTRLLEILQALEREAAAAEADEDAPGAEWLRREATRLRDAAFGPVPAPVSVTVPTAKTTLPTKPPFVPVDATAKVPVLTPQKKPSQKAKHNDLVHWESMWEDLTKALVGGHEGAGRTAALLRARAVFCGAHSFVLRESADQKLADDVKAAGALRNAIVRRLEELGVPWCVAPRWASSEEPKERAARLRLICDSYFRTAIAWEVFLDEQEHPSASESRRYRLQNAYWATRYHQALLGRFGLKDALTDQLVTEVGAAAREAGACEPQEADLSSDTPLVTTRTLSALLEVGDRTEAERAAVKSADARDQAVEEVLKLAQSRPDFGIDPEKLAEDRTSISSALRQAFEVGVPPSNKAMRDVLLDRWHSLLDGMDGFEVFLREVQAELDRRNQPVGEEDAEAAASGGDNGVERLALALRPFMEGKSVLILGGVPRVHTAPRLKAALGCASVEWPEAKKNDTPDKFESDMRHADLILIVKSYARHAISEAAAAIANEMGTHRVLLSAGYGVAKIISQLHEYCAKRGLVGAAA